MKQLLLLPAFLLTAHLAISQQSALHEFIGKYQHDKAFTYAYLSKDLFEVTIKTDIDQKDWSKLHQVVENLGSLRILAADEINNGTQLYKEALGYVAKDDLEELLSVQDGDDKVRMWVKEDGKILTDLVLLVGTPEAFVLVCFSGNLELNNIMELAGMFNAAEARSLAQSSKAAAVNFSVFPNPTNGAFSVQYPDEKDAPKSLSVYDQNGKVAAEVNLSGATRQDLNLRDLPAGTYWFQLKTASGKVGIHQVQVVK